MIASSPQAPQAAPEAGVTHEHDEQGELVAIRVDAATWNRWAAERRARAAQARPPRRPRAPRLEQAEAENAQLRREVHRLRCLADVFATMLAAQAKPCPCIADALEDEEVAA